MCLPLHRGGAGSVPTLLCRTRIRLVPEVAMSTRWGPPPPCLPRPSAAARGVAVCVGLSWTVMSVVSGGRACAGRRVCV